MKKLHVDICVLGAGAGGLSVAAGAAQMGATVALIESGKMGGDCLNYGCVPSKAILAAAKCAEQFRTSDSLGIKSIEPQIDFAKVMSHIHGIIKKIGEEKDSVERFTKLGVKVIQEHGEFIDAKTVKAGSTFITARRFVIATGSSPKIPSFPGLDKISFYTNETIFDLTKKPEHLIIIGGGPIGCELGQAFLMLGTKVTILEVHSLLSHDEPDLVNLLRNHFLEQGLNLHEQIKIIRVSQDKNQLCITIEKNGDEINILGSDLLIATGRNANVSHLNLESADVRYSPKGINVNKKLQTSNKKIYAIGDATDSFQFTHIANYHAGIVLRNILFRLPAKTNYDALPWVTYTEPELAHVGLSTKDAQKKLSEFKTLTWSFNEIDRALAENKTFGKIKVITTTRGKILGATILGPNAGELIIPWIMAIQQKKSIHSMTDFIIPYPTFSEIHKFVASEFYKKILFSKWTQKIINFLRVFG